MTLLLILDKECPNKRSNLIPDLWKKLLGIVQKHLDERGVERLFFIGDACDGACKSEFLWNTNLSDGI